MNMFHSMVGYINAKVYRIPTFTRWIIHKGLVLFTRTLLFFAVCFILYYGIECVYPVINKESHIAMEWHNDDYYLERLTVPAMLLHDDEQQRVMHRSNPYHDLRLIGQSLKVALQIVRMGNGSDQIFKVEDGPIQRLQAIDFIQNPYRILYVQRGIKLLTKIFWSAFAMTAIVVVCSLRRFSS